jgi:hypothetical protein
MISVPKNNPSLAATDTLLLLYIPPGISASPSRLYRKKKRRHRSRNTIKMLYN